MVMVKPWESTIPHSRPDLGAAAVCSFYATKVITSSGGEGGMVLTDDQALARADLPPHMYPHPELGCGC